MDSPLAHSRMPIVPDPFLCCSPTSGAVAHKNNRGNAYQRRYPDFIHGTIVAGRFYLLFFRFPGIGRVIQEVRREVVYCRMLPGMLFKPLDTAGNAPADGVAARPVKEW